MIEFAHFSFIYLLLLPILVYGFSPVYLSQRAALKVPFIKKLMQASGESTAQKKAYSKASKWQIFLALLVWSLLILALMKPEFVGEPISKTISQRDIVVAIDLSDSMKTKDMRDANGSKISRLDAVKSVMGKFLDDRKGEKIALIVFGSSAFLQAPFTDDTQTLQTMLDQMQVSMAGPQTAIGDAIGLSVKLLNKVNTHDRLVILLTDGTDTASKIPPKKAANLAWQNHMEIVTIAFGSKKYKGQYPIDTQALQFIAKHTHGKFFYAQNEASLKGIINEINKLKPKKVKKLSYRPTEELFLYPAAAALLILLLQAMTLLFREYRMTRRQA